jgi:hypothetical protein
MIPAILYSTVFLYAVIIMTVIVAVKLSNQNYQMIRRGDNNSQIALIITFIFALWLGRRPLHSVFGDSYYYGHTFNLMKVYGIDGSSRVDDWLWNSLSYFCSQIMDVSAYFTIVSIGYFGFTFLACRILVKNNVLAALLFMFGAFSFYSYGTNGIRNGLACSIVLFAIALYSSYRKGFIITLILSFIAVNIHKSAILPLTSLFVSIYIIKSFKGAYTFWILSIIISLIAGSFFNSFFAGLGFDDRLSYLTDQTHDKFSYTGFRWDFLIYSMMPILLGYYVVIKRGISDKVYLILLNTYTISNAFWVMIIRANFSNRFAYLSWFMLPIVLAYPLFKFDIWGDSQGKRASQIMLAHVGFTWFMAVVY